MAYQMQMLVAMLHQPVENTNSQYLKRKKRENNREKGTKMDFSYLSLKLFQYNMTWIIRVRN